MCPGTAGTPQFTKDCETNICVHVQQYDGIKCACATARCLLCRSQCSFVTTLHLCFSVAIWRACRNPPAKSRARSGGSRKKAAAAAATAPATEEKQRSLKDFYGLVKVRMLCKGGPHGSSHSELCDALSSRKAPSVMSTCRCCTKSSCACLHAHIVGTAAQQATQQDNMLSF